MSRSLEASRFRIRTRSIACLGFFSSPPMGSGKCEASLGSMKTSVIQVLCPSVAQPSSSLSYVSPSGPVGASFSSFSDDCYSWISASTVSLGSLSLSRVSASPQLLAPNRPNFFSSRMHFGIISLPISILLRAETISIKAKPHDCTHSELCFRSPSLSVLRLSFSLRFSPHPC